MIAADMPALLDRVLELLSRAENPSGFDLEQSLIDLKCEPAKAELLADYLPAACGRAFLREIGVVPADTYQRANADGSWWPPMAFTSDPLWTEVEAYVETIQTNPARRKLFSLAAQLSAEVDAVNRACDAGTPLADLAGASFASVFVAPLKHRP